MYFNSAMLTNQPHRAGKVMAITFVSPPSAATLLGSAEAELSWWMVPDQTADQILGPGSGKRGSKWESGVRCFRCKNLECWQGCSGKEGVDLPQRPSLRPDTVFSPKSHRRGFLCCRCQAPGARVSALQATISPSPLVGRYTFGPRC